MQELAGLLPAAAVALFMLVMAIIAWRQDHPKAKHP